MYMYVCIYIYIYIYNLSSCLEECTIHILHHYYYYAIIYTPSDRPAKAKAVIAIVTYSNHTSSNYNV